MTDFCACANIIVLWTMPTPDPIAVGEFPGKAPHGITPRAKPRAAQAFRDTVP